MVVLRILDAEDVVADRAEAAEDVLEHLRAVDQQPECLAYVHLVERGHVDAHGERHPAAALRDQVAHPSVLERGDARVRQQVDAVDGARDEGVHLARLVAVVGDDHLVEVWQRLPVGAVLPVVRVLDEDALLAGREGLVHERPCPDRLLRVVVGRHDALFTGVRHGEGERRVRRVTWDCQGEGVDELDVLQVHGGEPERPREVLAHDALHGEEHILGREGLAVVEGDPLLQPDRPLGGILVGRDLLGQRQLGDVVQVPLDHLVVQLRGAGEVDVLDAGVPVECVGGATAGQPSPQRPTPLRFGPGARRRRVRRRGGRRSARLEDAAGPHGSHRTE